MRIHDVLLQPDETNEIASRMRERLAQRGETVAEVVVVQGGSQETLRLFGAPYSVNRVRTAMFNASIHWAPLELGYRD